jgi:hypothetical protein
MRVEQRSKVEAKREYAWLELGVLEQLAQLVSEELAFQRQLRSGDILGADTQDLRVRAVEAADRRVRSLENFKKVGYTRVLWLRNKRTEKVKQVRLTPTAEILSEPYVRPLESRVARIFGREDVELGKTVELDLTPGAKALPEPWELVGLADVQDCRIDVQLIGRSDITRITYDLEDVGGIEINGLRATLLALEHQDADEALPSQESPRSEPEESDEEFWWQVTAESVNESRNLEALEAWVLTNATDEQRAVLEQVHGLVHIPGVAGSGKTIFAMGRLRYLSNIYIGQREVAPVEEGEIPVDPNAFDPDRMVAFAASPSLRNYLRETAAALALEQLNVRIFSEFMREQLTQRELIGALPYRRDLTSRPTPVQTSLTWARELDGLIAEELARRWTLPIRSETPPTEEPDLTAVAAALARVGKGSFRLANLLSQVEMAIERAAESAAKLLFVGVTEEAAREEAIASIRRRAAGQEIRAVRKTLRAFEVELQRAEGPGDGRSRQIEKRVEQLTAEMEALKTPAGQARFEVTTQQIRTELPRARRRLENRGRLAAGRKAHQLATQWKAHITTKFRDLRLEQVLASALAARAAESLSAELRTLRERFSRGVLMEADREAIACLYALCARGATWTAQIPRWTDMSTRSAVFIDEAQDFTEVDILLMSLCADPVTECVTLVGDVGQQLGREAAVVPDNWAPHISVRFAAPLLHRNFRQMPALGAISSGFRSLHIAPSSIEVPPAVEPSPVPVFVSGNKGALAELISSRIATLPYGISIAAVLPDPISLAEWHGLLADPLLGAGRETTRAERDRLIERFIVHFTMPLDAKGLQFTSVVIPDLSLFDATSPVAMRQLYVALSRARSAILLCSTRPLAEIGFADMQVHGLWREVGAG